jgi:hypothetical protein
MTATNECRCIRACQPTHHPIIIFPAAAARALETVHGQRHGASLQRSTYVYAQLALSLAPLSATVRVLFYPIAHTQAGSRFVFWPHSGNGVTQREPGRDRLRDRKCATGCCFSGAMHSDWVIRGDVNLAQIYVLDRCVSVDLRGRAKCSLVSGGRFIGPA